MMHLIGLHKILNSEFFILKTFLRKTKTLGGTVKVVFELHRKLKKLGLQKMLR